MNHTVSAGGKGAGLRGPGDHPSDRLDRFFASAFLLTGAIFLTFGLAEFGSRIYLNHLAPEAIFRRYATVAQLTARYGETGRFYAPHPYLRFYPTPGFTRGANKHNSLGYRGDEIGSKRDGEFRIVCLGGSTTYTSMVSDYRLSYPYLLQESLAARGYEHVRVINAGVPGWTTWQTLINLQFRVLDLEPDLILVYHALNDIPPRIVWPPEAYRGDNTGWLAADFWLHHRPDLLDASTLLRILRIRIGYARPQNTLDWLDPPTSTAYSREFDEQLRHGTYPSGLFRDVPVQRILEVNRPVFFRRNLKNLVEIARANGIKVVLATFAHLTPEKRPGDDQSLGSHYSDEFFSAIGEANKITREIGVGTSALTFDFAAVFPNDASLYATITRGGQALTDPYHVNATGARLKASLFAEFLIANVLDPVRPSVGFNTDFPGDFATRRTGAERKGSSRSRELAPQAPRGGPLLATVSIPKRP